MNSFRKKAIFIVALEVVFLSLEVQALPSKEVEITFFSDASKTEDVGFQLLTCNGRILREGIRTKYATRMETACGPTSPLPENNVPCEFTPKGCGFLPRQ